jgi:pimeloyl-ACP methyl ester carboxylesterase
VQLNYVLEDYREPWLGEPEVTVLLHHGFIKNLHFWAPFVPAIARRYRVLRYDVRGAGRSTIPSQSSNTSWTADRLVKDALCLMDVLKISKIHWAGFESGGIVGLLFAADHPERAQSVACFNTPYRSPASQNKMRDIFRCGHANYVEAVDKLGFDKWVRELRDQGVLVDLGKPQIVDWVVEQVKTTPPSVAKEWLKVMWDGPDILSDLPERVDVPVLQVAGANHVFGCEPPLLDNLRGKLKHGREVVYIPGVATGVQLLAGDRCAVTYLDFLGTTSSGR